MLDQVLVEVGLFILRVGLPLAVTFAAGVLVGRWDRKRREKS